MADDGEGSGAARSAHRQDDPAAGAPEDRGGIGFLSRLVGAFTGPEAEEEAPPPRVEPPPGLLNLRRMRVEDVMIPKAEIVAVPVDIDKDELVRVFRESGMTRLPVYDGTLDTPLGMAHLKDFALQHGFNGTGATFDLKAMLRQGWPGPRMP